MKELIQLLDAELPAILWRSEWPQYKEKFGLPRTRGSMSNADYKGKGPKSVKIGGKVAYLKADFLSWLEQQ